MIARARGEHDTHWGRWRPGSSREDTAPGRQRVLPVDDELAVTEADSRAGAPPSQRRQVGRWLVVLAVAIIAAYLAVSWSVAQFSPASAGTATASLPGTPRAWLDAYEAAAIDNPGRVCSQLFAPQLAQAYGRVVHGSCQNYFGQITSFSVTVRRVLVDGGTAVLDLRQTVRPRAWAVVLDRRAGGWQAVDLLAGSLAR
jgi:hypothetical protein